VPVLFLCPVSRTYLFYNGRKPGRTGIEFSDDTSSSISRMKISHNAHDTVRFCPSKKPKYSYSYIQARGFISSWQHKLTV
jgi:hypothetical protein